MTRFVVILGFCVSFAAGIIIGLEMRQTSAASPTAPPTTRGSGHRNGWLDSALNLTPQQQEQMKQIWSDTAHRGGHEQEDARRQLRRERDEAIAALIRSDDKTRFDEITKTYSEKIGAVDREMRESFRTAVERTKQLLTPEQRVKYDELLSRHQWDRGRGERDNRDNRPGATRATSKPSSQP